MEDTSRGWIGWAQIGLLVFMVAVGIYFARAPSVAALDGEAISNASPPSVRVHRPMAGSHSLTIQLTGEVSARETVSLRPLASGRVTEVSPSLRAGETFRAGETLFVIDAERTELRLEKARGALDAARGRLRHHTEQGALDAAQYRRENPGAEVPASIARLGRIDRFEGRVRAALAQVKLAELDLEETKFSLPFNGTVIAAPISVGDVVSPAADVGRVFQSGSLEVRASIQVDELEYLGDPRGRTAVVTAHGQRYEAVVAQVSSVLAPRTRLSMLLLDFTNTDTLPTPGSFARISVEGPTFENAFLLPIEAHRVGESVWLVNDGTLLAETPRTLGRTDSGWIVEEFDIKDGVVLGAVPEERSGLPVTAIAVGSA